MTETTSYPTPDDTKTLGGDGTDGHYEGNGTSTTPLGTTADGDGQPEGNTPPKP